MVDEENDETINIWWWIGGPVLEMLLGDCNQLPSNEVRF